MIRSAALRSRHLPLAGLHPDTSENQKVLGAYQSPSKLAFFPRVDIYGRPYYEPRTRPFLRRANIGLNEGFFELSDLVLDLDADGSPNVRSYNDDDELRMLRRWVPPERVAVRDCIKQYKQQILQVRLSTHKAFCQRLAVRQIFAYDVVSAALRGLPNVSPTTPSPELENERGYLVQTCVDNGVPDHAFGDDRRLLRWMNLRRQALLGSWVRTKAHRPTREHLGRFLENAPSLDALRRNILFVLHAGMYIGSFFEEKSLRRSIVYRIRYALKKVLERSPNRRETSRQTLAFLGNLTVQFQVTPGMYIGAPLIGLAIRLSAELGDLSALTQWVGLAFDRNSFNERRVADDTQKAMLWLSQHLGSGQGSRGLQRDSDRQHLFYILTGTQKKGHEASPNCIRHVVLNYVLRESAWLKSGAACSLYSTYLMLLAQLGAARVLWSEWQAFVELTPRLLDLYAEDLVATMALAFHGAVNQVVQSVPPVDDERPGEMDWYQCSKRDYHSVARQKAGSYRAVSSTDISPEEALQLLRLPLSDWTGEVRRRRIKLLSPEEQEKCMAQRPELWDNLPKRQIQVS